MCGQRDRASVIHKWLPLARPWQDAPRRLFCFPHAGGAAGAYRTWIEALAPAADVCALEPPGRWSRLAERPHRRIDPWVEDVVAAIAPLCDRPFAFFGYSLGSIIAFEVARRMRDVLGMQPCALMVAAAAPPQIALRRTVLHRLPDDAFVEQLNRRYAAIPAAVRRDRDLLSAMLPSLRADIEAIETYHYGPGEPLQCPIVAFAGTLDEGATEERMARWSEQTAGPFRLERFNGGHFFIQTAGPSLVQSVRRTLLGETVG